MNVHKNAGLGGAQSSRTGAPCAGADNCQIRCADIKAENIASLTDPKGAHVDCNVQINLHSDGPVKASLLGCLTVHLARPDWAPDTALP